MIEEITTINPDVEIEDYGKWPANLYQFAWFHDREDRLQDLAQMAEPEEWSYQNSPNEHSHPVLFNYLAHTYGRLVEESKIGLSENGQFSCLNTGLVTPNQEPIFASFEVNRREDAQPWYFQGWFPRGNQALSRFSQLPDRARYFDDPSCLVFDERIDFRLNVEHIVNETPRERFPDPYSEMEAYALQTILRGAVENAKARVAMNYKTAIPQYYRGRVQLLLPLCLESPQRADLAMVVERHSSADGHSAAFYRASTCLTLDMAYNNARLLAKPDRDWLQP